MNVNEFSIACKLINLKLRGFEVPKVLPPTLLASLAAVGGTPTRTPTTGMSPSGSIAALHSAGPPPVPPQPAILQQQQYATVPGVVQVPPARPVIPPQPVIPSQPLIQAGQPLTQAHVPPAVPPPPAILQQQQQQQQIQQTAAIPPMMAPPSQQQPMVIPGQMMGMAPQPAYSIPQQQQQQALISTVPNSLPGVVSVPAPIQSAVPQPALIHQDSQSLLTGLAGAPVTAAPMQMTQIPTSITGVSTIPTSVVPPVMSAVIPGVVPTATPIPALPTPPSGTQSRSMSISERAPSIESP